MKRELFLLITKQIGLNGFMIHMKIMILKMKKRKLVDNTRINNLKKSYGYSPILCYYGHEMVYNEELSFYPVKKRNE